MLSVKGNVQINNYYQSYLIFSQFKNWSSFHFTLGVFQGQHGQAPPGMSEESSEILQAFHCPTPLKTQLLIAPQPAW